MSGNLRTLILLLLPLLIGISVASERAVYAQNVTDEQVLNKIKQLQQALLGAQANSHWESRADFRAHERLAQDHGETALVVYALLASGMSPQGNDRLMSGIQYLEAQDLDGNYAVALRAHVWAKLPPRYLDKLELDAQSLVENLQADGSASYHLDGKGESDASNTQYNMLGVWEASKRGIEFSGDYWQRIENYFLSFQSKDGGWGYEPPGNRRVAPYASMTAAALTCLFISNDELHNGAYKEPGAGQQIKTYQAIQRGLKWMDQYFDPTKATGVASSMRGVANHYGYYVMGVERVGLASGYKYFNDKDWYRSCAAYIVNNKTTDDRWHGPNVTNAFLLAFLAAGRKPVMINKLKVDGLRWDNRPRDLAKLTAWTSNESEKDMLWQVIELRREAKSFMDAPILYLASDQAFEPDETAQSKLKQYMDAGGLFFTTSDAKSSSFDASIEQLAKNIYPNYEWKRVPPDHYIYNLVYKTRAGKTPLWGIHNGVRWLMIHSGRDIAWILHTGEIGKGSNDWQTMANLFHYATERSRVRPKLAQHYPVLKAGASGPSKTVARVKYEGNWNAEPAAWEIGGIFMKNASKVSPSLKEVDLASLGTVTERFAHLSGTGKAEFTDEQMSQMETFAKNGGTLLIEATGGDVDFFLSMRSKLSEIGEIKLLDPKHALNKGTSFGGFDATQVGYRTYRSYRTKTPQSVPSLMAIMIDGRPAIILSGDDLSNGMLDQPVWGVYGYNHNSACMLMANMLLWANK